MIRIRITTKPLGWSRDKIRQMKGDMLDLFAQNGAPNADFEVLDDEAAKPPPPKVLYMKCGACQESWEGQMMTACPKCGSRAAVSKGPKPEPAPATVLSASVPAWICGGCNYEFTAEKRMACPKCGVYVKVRKAEVAAA